MTRPARVLAAAAVLLVGLAQPAARVGSAPAPAPDSFSVTASAEAVSSLSTVPVVLALQAETGIAVSRLKLNSQPFIVAEAAPVFVPVLGALQGGAAIAGLADCVANFPGDPHEASCGGPGEQVAGVDLAAGSGRALAAGGETDPADTRGEAAARAAGIGLPGLGVGSVASAVRSEIVDGRITAGASTALSDITIAGALRITSLHAEISGALGGTPGSGALSTAFDVGGATLAGIPVAIDEQGLRVQTQGLPAGLLDQLQDQVNALVADLGLSIEVTPPRVIELAKDGTILEAASGGLQVSLDLADTGAFVHLTLGRAQMSMSASRFDALAAPTPPTVPVDVAGLPPSSPLSGAPPTVPPPPAPTPGAGVPVLPQGGQLAAIVDTSDWKDLYLAVVVLLALLPLLTTIRRAPWGTPKREALS